jgi:hypothetical protein
MELEVGGRRGQHSCAGVRLAEERKGSLAKVCSVLLEVRVRERCTAGSCMEQDRITRLSWQARG